MFKVMAFLVKKTGISRDELIDHYENHHVPLIMGLAPAPLIYRRNYVTHEQSAAGTTAVDIVTELVFTDRPSYQSWVAAMYAPNSGVAADEETFLDRTRTTSCTVDEYSTG